MNLLFKHDKDPDVKPAGNAQTRQEKVKNFVVHINEDEAKSMESLMKEESQDVPEYKGEVYFSSTPANHNSPSSFSQAAASTVKTATTKFSGLKKETKILISIIAAVVILAFAISIPLISCINDALAINRGDEIITVNVPKDATTKELIELFHDNGLIKNQHFCEFFYNLSSAAKGTGMPKGLSTMEKIGYRVKVLFSGPPEPDYISGVYYLKPEMGIEGMLFECRAVQAGPRTVTLVFPEGWTVPQIAKRLEEYGVCTANHFTHALIESDFEYDFLPPADKLKNRTYRLEGYLFPSTYDFFEGESANAAIRRLLDAFEKEWTDKYDKRAKELGYSIDEIITIASIIQREAADESQMGLISSVIHNRLKNPAVSNGKLECDSTKDYIKKYIKPVMNVELVTHYMDAYNTYLVKGLPPGPICNPGAEAIEAALYPAKTNYMFFCHDKFGNIYMAKTKSQHDANVLEAFSKD